MSPKRLLPGLLVLVGVGILAPSPLEAQEGPGRMVVGAALGQATAEQRWDSSYEAESARGVSLGVFVEVPTPVSHLSVRAEAVYVARTSTVWDPQSDPDRALETSVRSHYLVLPLHGKVGMTLGPATAFVFGGPTMDLLLSTRCGAGLCQALGEEKPSVFSVSGGVGVSARTSGGYEGGVEVRWTEGLSEAYRGEAASVKWRTVELLLRVGQWR